MRPPKIRMKGYQISAMSKAAAVNAPPRKIVQKRNRAALRAAVLLDFFMSYEFSMEIVSRRG